MATTGQVQAAFGSGEDVFSRAFDAAWAVLATEEPFSTMPEPEKKLLATQMMKQACRAQLDANLDAKQKRREGILNGYRDYAEKQGITWRANAAALKDRGMDVWEKELSDIHQEAAKRGVVVPSYYEVAGQGPLHSYAEGNCNWEAAFDAYDAFLLVHCHHFPSLSPQGCFDAIHADVNKRLLAHVPAAAGATTVLDLGAGSGTSTFAAYRAMQHLTGLRMVGVDLSPHFVAVARHRVATGSYPGLEFCYGDAQALEPLGFGAGSVDVVLISETTHEMPLAVIRRVFREAHRVLRPGGAIGWLDLNRDQILADNGVANLANRVAMDNEPYFDEFLQLDPVAELGAAGFVVQDAGYPETEQVKAGKVCSIRLVIATKQASGL